MTSQSVPGYRSWAGLTAAIRFLLTLRHSGHDPGERRRSLQRHGTALDVYEPAGETTAGSLVFVHGMAAAGYRDPRVVDLSMALVAAGYRVVVPDIPSIRALKIQREQPREVQALIDAIAGDPELVPEGRCAVMAVSFSSAFALHAAGDPAVAPSLSGLCLVGGYSDLDAVCGFLIRAEHADRYGFLLIARSYFNEVEPETEGFLTALERCITAAIDADSDWDPVDMLDTSRADEARLAALLREPARRAAFQEKVREAAAGEWSGYRVRKDLARVDLPVMLIHGREDRVIPADESRRLAAYLSERGVPHRLCITGLLSHGDSRLHLSELPEIARFTAHLAWFFAAVGRLPHGA